MKIIEIIIIHPKDDVDRLYVSRKEGGIGLTSIEDRVDASIRRLEDYLEKRGGKTDYSHQKQYWQHEDQQNNNNQKIIIRRKITLWTF